MQSTSTESYFNSRTNHRGFNAYQSVTVYYNKDVLIYRIGNSLQQLSNIVFIFVHEALFKCWKSFKDNRHGFFR